MTNLVKQAQRNDDQQLAKLRQKVWLLSDTVLYPEAVAFIRCLVGQYKTALPSSLTYLAQLVQTMGTSNPLPTSQVAGLLNIARLVEYDELSRFVAHQRERNWPENKRSIKIVYTALERYFSDIYKRRISSEFHLTTDSGQQLKEVMALLAQEFVQHLLAENGLLVAKERANRRGR
jgi:hypothetical protein